MLDGREASGSRSMKIRALGSFLCLVISPQIFSDEPPSTCPAGRPWYLPPVEKGYDVSEQYLVLGASTPVSITVCNCSARIAGKPHPYVWINASKQVDKSTPSPSEVKKLIDEATKNHLTMVADKTNTIVVSRLGSPGCTDVQGLSVLVMHSDETGDRAGTYTRPPPN
jgi:hypothetical protein